MALAIASKIRYTLGTSGLIKSSNKKVSSYDDEIQNRPVLVFYHSDSRISL